MKRKLKFSIRKLTNEYNIDRDTTTKVTADAKSEREARAAIEAWLESRVNGVAPDDVDPVTGLSWWKAKLREDVLKSRDVRSRRKLLDGGELIPVGVISTAFKEVEHILNRFASELYNSGVPLDEIGRSTVQRLADLASRNANSYLRHWIDHQAELARGNGGETL